jgi:hypothetical protein
MYRIGLWRIAEIKWMVQFAIHEHFFDFHFTFSFWVCERDNSLNLSISFENELTGEDHLLTT